MEENGLRVEIRLFERGNVKAFVDISFTVPVGEITLKGFRVIHKAGEAPWVGFPTSRYPKDGEVVNKPIIEVTSRVKRQIADAVLAEYERAQQAS